MRKEEEGVGCRQGPLWDPLAPRERIFGMALAPAEKTHRTG